MEEACLPLWIKVNIFTPFFVEYIYIYIYICLFNYVLNLTSLRHLIFKYRYLFGPNQCRTMHNAPYQKREMDMATVLK